MKYQFIDHNKQEFPVVVMCRVLDVSESGFYAWRKRPASPRQREDAQLTEAIRQEFRTHQGRYGSPLLHVELRDQGRSIARKRVARLMTRQQGSVRNGNENTCSPRTGTSLTLSRPISYIGNLQQQNPRESGSPILPLFQRCKDGCISP